MATGFFLYHLDKTTCGGRILSGAFDDTYEINGIERQQVREGDPVTCGKHKGFFRVCGGMGDTYEVGGELKEWAGSMDRLWFMLQRWDKYGYKPFITEMNASVEIRGRLGE